MADARTDVTDVTDVTQQPTVVERVEHEAPEGAAAADRVVEADRARPRRFRIVADPWWATQAAILVALDGLAIWLLSWSGWLVATVLVISAALGSYRHRHTLVLSEGDGRYVILTIAVVIPMFALDDVPIHIALFGLATLGVLFLSRTVGFALVKVLRRVWQRPVFIAGAGPIALALERALREHREYGLEPTGFIADVDVPGAGAPVYPFAGAPRLVEERNAIGVIVAFGPESYEEVHELIRSTEVERRRIWLVPRQFDLSPRRDHIWAIAVAVVHRPPLYDPLVRLAKRVIDVAVASVALVVLSPIWLGIAILVVTTSRGPVFFTQQRVGQGGKPFTIVKFRTMRVGSDAEPLMTTPDDPRRTPAGRILRRTALDEMPQLLNVIRGDMSLIGPRPEQRLFVDQFSRELPTYPERTRVAGGITGLAQVQDLRGLSSIDERLRFDNRYIDQYSLFLDLTLAIRTVLALFTSRHSY